MDEDTKRALERAPDEDEIATARRTLWSFIDGNGVNIDSAQGAMNVMARVCAAFIAVRELLPEVQEFINAIQRNGR